jgi:hypothetical protein
MTKFESLDDVHKARLPPNLLPVVRNAMQAVLTSTEHYVPNDDGYVALVTPSDYDVGVGHILGRKWEENCFEGISYDSKHKCYLTWILRNNQYCVTIIVPNDPEIDFAIRSRMVRELDMEGGDND